LSVAEGANQTIYVDKRYRTKVLEFLNDDNAS